MNAVHILLFCIAMVIGCLSSINTQQSGNQNGVGKFGLKSIFRSNLTKESFCYRWEHYTLGKTFRTSMKSKSAFGLNFSLNKYFWRQVDATFDTSPITGPFRE